MLINAKYLGRVSALAVALGIGAAVANTPGFAVAEPSDSGSSSDSSSSSSATGSSSDSASDMSSTGSTPSSGSPAAAPGSSVDVTSGVGQGSVDGQSGSTSSVGDPSTADPRSGVVQSSGGAHTSSTSASGDPTASAGATSTPAAAFGAQRAAGLGGGRASGRRDTLGGAGALAGGRAGGGRGDPGRRRGHPDPEGTPRRGASGAEFRGQRPTESVRVGGCIGGDPAVHGGGAGRCDPPAARATADRSTARRGQHHGGVGARRLLGRVARCWWGAGVSRRGRWCVGAAEHRGPGVVQCAGMGGAKSGCLR